MQKCLKATSKRKGLKKYTRRSSYACTWGVLQIRNEMILAKNILISLKFLREKKKPAPIDKKNTHIYAHANYFIFLLNQKWNFSKIDFSLRK